MTLLNSIHKRRQKNRCNSYLSSWKAISFIYIFFILFIQLFADPNLKEKVIENNVRNVKLRFLYIFCGKTVPFTSLAKCENHHEITQYRYCLLYKYTLLWWNCTRLLDGRRGTMCREDVDRGVAMHRSSLPWLFAYRRASLCFNTDNSLLVLPTEINWLFHVDELHLKNKQEWVRSIFVDNIMNLSCNIWYQTFHYYTSLIHVY